MMETVTLSSRGQLVIPERIRNEFHMSAGTRLVLIEKGKQIILEKEKDFLEQLQESEKEKIGWLLLAEQNLKKLWDNPKDDEVWSKYL